MGVERVECHGRSSAHTDAVWAYVMDFTRPWHPAIARMQAEVGPGGAVRRRFWVKGEDKSYLEQLTYLSHSDRVMSYVALEGIDGITRYDARFQLSDDNQGGSAMVWSARIVADPQRVKAIAAGTRQIFDAGLEALASLGNFRVVVSQPQPKPVKLQSTLMESDVVLGLAVAPAGVQRGDTMCIFLHGIGGQRGNWNAQLAEIGAIVPCVSLDLRGYGDSALGPHATEIGDYINDILAVADHFQARKIILCGLSYGAWIATSFAMRHGDRLAGLVLAGGCTGMSEADPDARAAFRHARETPLDAGQKPADFAPGVVRVIAGPNASEQVQQTLLDSMAAIPAATYRDALNCFTNPVETFDFAQISCPVLLMTGEHDQLAPPDEIRRVSQRMHAAAQSPDIRFEVIKGAGHVCNLEQPGAFNTHLARFVQRIVGDVPDAILSDKEQRRRAKHRRILDAALAEFARNGFSGASMQAIAKRAGVSKPTLYQYFGQKNALLAAVLDDGKSELLAPFENTDGKPLVPVLWHFAWTYAAFVLRPDMLSLARLIIGEAERLPDVARDYQHNGPLKALAGVVDYLETQKSAGTMTFEDAELAAQNLWSLILSAPREHLLHNPDKKLDQNALGRSIINGLEVFLKAYSTNVVLDIATLADIVLNDKRGRHDG